MSSITLYAAKLCPFAHRVQIALTEANAKFKVYNMDLQNKPEWYASRVNPASKVPTLAYGGPDVPPEDPSPESVKLTESLILVEFVADLFPESELVPKDPVRRAQARLFVDVVASKFVPAYFKFLVRGEGYDDLLTASEALQALLPDAASGGAYAMGEQYTIADVALAPFVGRLQVVVADELGRYPLGQGRAFLEALRAPRFDKYARYASRLLERQSFRDTFDAEHIKHMYVTRYFRT